MLTTDVSKDKVTSIFGIILMLFALSCYMFDFPKVADLYVNVSEFLLGIMLLFIDGKKIANKVFSRFSKDITK